jgi:hypothetical protein
MVSDDMAVIARLIGQAISDESQAPAIADEVANLVGQHPAYPRG